MHTLYMLEHFSVTCIYQNVNNLIEVSGFVERVKEQTILPAVLQIFSPNESIWIANSNTPC